MSSLALRPGIHAVRFMLVRAPGFTSWAISREGLPWGGFSHAMNLLRDGTVIDSRSDKQPCLDGVKRAGVQHRPHDYIAWTRAMVIEMLVTATLYREWADWLASQIGDDYDGAAIWGFIRGVRDHVRHHWICSALCMGGGRKVRIFRGGRVSILADSDISPDVLAAIAVRGAGGEVTYRYGF